MYAGLDPLSLLELDGPLFDAVERVLVEAVGGRGGGVVELENGNGAGEAPVGALEFATAFGPRRRRNG